METSIFETKNLCLTISGKAILTDISLSIPEGKTTAIIGPSGCGKSSFISCLNGLVYRQSHVKTSGSAYWKSINLMALRGDYKSFRRQVGTLFQNPVPFPTTIRKNLLIPIKEHLSLNRHDRQQLIHKSLVSVGLWDEVKDRLDQHAHGLSGGQRQRLCLARSLLLEPNALLMDEPCSALDPISSAAVENLILELKQKVTTIIVTHNIQQAKRMADHIILFWYDHERGGYVMEQGPTELIFKAPKERTTSLYLQGSVG